MGHNLSQFLMSLMSVFFIASCGYVKVNSSKTTNLSSESILAEKQVQINSVSSSAANGMYKVGDAIDISVEFTNPVIVSGTPSLILNSGVGARAIYLSGSGSNILIFRYVVADNENSINLNYTSTSALNLNNGTIRDNSNDASDANLELPLIGNGSDLGSVKNISIDTMPPLMPSNLDDGSWSNIITQSPVFTFTDGTDNQSSVVTYKAKIVDNTTNSDFTSYATIFSGSVVSNLNLINGHNYSFVIKSVDLAGNESAPMASNGWTVDTIRPTQPGVITVGAVPSNFKQATPVFTFTNSTDALSGVSHYEIEIRKLADGSIVKPYSIASGNGSGLSYSEGVDFLTSGEIYFANIRAVDMAGNMGTVRASANWMALGTVVQLCPVNFIRVPPRSPYSSVEFCVAKYEMKILGNDIGDTIYNSAYTAESRSRGTPWVNVNRAQAMTECQSLGPGYSLISNAQWQTIAQNAELNPSNWTSGSVGSELMYEGHSDSVPLMALEVSNVADKYNLTGNNSSEAANAGKNQRRTLMLSNGEEIWDFSGNIIEWVSDDIVTNFATDNFWSFVTSATYPVVGSVGGLNGTSKVLFGPAGTYPNLQIPSVNYGGFGRITLTADPNANGASALLRGGRWLGDNYVGVFRVSQVNPALSTNYVGFRCVFTP